MTIFSCIVGPNKSRWKNDDGYNNNNNNNLKVRQNVKKKMTNRPGKFYR